MNRIYSKGHLALTLSATVLIAACSSDREPAPITYRTPLSAPAETQPTQQAPAPQQSYAVSSQPDSRGIIQHDGYQSIRAQRGDTVQSMAARAGITESELANYNGLSTQYVPREGDELVLPANAGGSPVAAAPAPAPVYNEPLAPAAPAPAPAQETVVASNAGWSAAEARAAIEDDSTTAVTPAPLAPPAAAPEPAQSDTAAVQPAPEPEPAPAPAPAASANASGPSGFVRPVDAGIRRPFSRAAGPDRNEGVDFATSAGDTVRAAGNGTVALISQSLGGLGTIVLIRHNDDYLTVYGRIDDVQVKKGDKVQAGQTIARVANLPEPQGPSLHYEIRRGAESIDPSPYL